MPLYLQQIAYTTEGWKALVNNPQNRFEAVRPAFERLGGKIVNAWFAFGDYDVVLVCEMPDNVSVAAMAMAVAAGGLPERGSIATASGRHLMPVKGMRCAVSG